MSYMMHGLGAKERKKKLLAKYAELVPWIAAAALTGGAALLAYGAYRALRKRGVSPEEAKKRAAAHVAARKRQEADLKKTKAGPRTRESYMARSFTK